MKKTLTLAVATLLSAAFMTSCKKDYTCTCKVLGQTVTVAIGKAKKKDAESTCTAAQTTYKMGDPNATCSL